MEFSNKAVQDKSPMKPAQRKVGCFLTNISKDEHENLVIEFRDSTGSTLRHVEWKPKKREEDSQEDYEKNVNMTLSRVKHIAGRFMTSEAADTIEGATWNDYVDSFIAKMNAASYKTVSVDLKVVLRKGTDGKYYSTLPKVQPFISSEKFPKEFTTNPAYDFYEIPSDKPDGGLPADFAPKPGVDSAF
jgi:hypothetical protein